MKEEASEKGKCMMKPPSAKVSSPCVSICALDVNDICVGCHRHADEIALWTTFSDEQKQEVLGKVREREQDALIG